MGLEGGSLAPRGISRRILRPFWNRHTPTECGKCPVGAEPRYALRRPKGPSAGSGDPLLALRPTVCHASLPARFRSRTPDWPVRACSGSRSARPAEGSSLPSARAAPITSPAGPGHGRLPRRRSSPTRCTATDPRRATSSEARSPAGRRSMGGAFPARARRRRIKARSASTRSTVFEVGYCTLNVRANTNMSWRFYDHYGPCTDIDNASNPAVVVAQFTAAGVLPGSSTSGVQSCWFVSFDLSNTTLAFVLSGDGDGTWDNDPLLDSFGWATIVNNTGLGGEGPLIAGACPPQSPAPGVGTVFHPGDGWTGRPELHGARDQRLVLDRRTDGHPRPTEPASFSAAVRATRTPRSGSRSTASPRSAARRARATSTRPASRRRSHSVDRTCWRIRT